MFYPKKLLAVLLLPIFFLTLIFIKPVDVKAQAVTEVYHKEIPLQVPIYGFTQPCKTEQNKGKHCVADVGEYIAAFYKYFTGAAAILATVMILFAGFQYVTASGNASRLEKAKSTMNGALIGLVLTLTAYVLLRTINPQLVSFNTLQIIPVKPEYLLSSVYCPRDTEGFIKLDMLQIYEDYKKEERTLKEEDLKCGEKYLIKGTESQTCLGHYCALEGNACALNANTGNYICTNAKEACESYGNVTSQAQCEAVSYRDTGFICRYQKGKDQCQWKREIGWVEGFKYNPCYNNDWASCVECLTPGAQKMLLPSDGARGPEFCDRNKHGVFESDSQIYNTGGKCVEPGQLGAVGIDAVCCRMKEAAESFYRYSCQESFSTQELHPELFPPKI